MGKLFLKRSQTTSRGGQKSSGSGGSRRGGSFGRNRHQQQQPKVQGSEAVATESQKVNAKTFKYPLEGFETWIENSLLYSLIRESSIFPVETVIKAIDEEDFTQYFVIKQKEQQIPLKRINEDNDDEDEYSSEEQDPRMSSVVPVATNVSYAQLTALLALAGEEWSSTSNVPQHLCKTISKQIIKYANKNSLDREQELKELLDPLIVYAKGRGRKQALQMLPWFAALTVSTLNPLAFYATYMSMLVANSDALSKGDRADQNTLEFCEMGSRHANVEKASLLEEDYNNESDDECVE